MSVWDSIGLGGQVAGCSVWHLQPGGGELLKLTVYSCHMIISKQSQSTTLIDNAALPFPRCTGLLQTGEEDC